MASKVKRDFEEPLKHLLIGTYDLKVNISGRRVYHMVMLDGYSRAILGMHTSFDNSESEVLKMVDKLVATLDEPATIYFCQRGGSNNKIYKEYIESQPMLKAPESSS